MDVKEMMGQALEKLEKARGPIQSLPESSQPSESEESKEERINRLVRDIPEVMREYGIPKRFIQKDLVGSLSLDVIKKGVCLTGKVGVGKTMAVCLLARDWLFNRLKNSTGEMWGTVSREAWKFVVYPEFIMRIQDSFKNKRSDESAWEMLEELAKTPYLIIDDLGAEKPTEYVRQATYYIINHREMNLLPTFITTNFSMDHLDENLDPRISSRIAGMCDIMRFEGNDRRIRGAK